ncbi:MAG TPA: aminotransferase class I/II-fold pyridoxal phosphate-dependent enzyme [Balneolales bacterium]|nr:aminotransferase class I/II-fold pyridoxal phosphate-dependent enzyme [Balneolales bacterium]
MKEEMLKEKKLDLHTQLAHIGHPSKKDPYGSHLTPIYQSSTFVFDDVESGSKLFAGEAGGASHTYTRIANPNIDSLEEALAILESQDFEDPSTSRALIFGSGMAAITAGILGLAHGRHVIAQKTLYGCTSEFLSEQASELGIDVTFVDGTNTDEIMSVLDERPDTALVYLESMANPTLEIVDITAIVNAAHPKGAKVMVDNTFATPYHLRPLALGVDVVAHSTTKYLSGHGTTIGGVLISRDQDLLNESVLRWRKNIGGIAGPFDAWLTLLGLKTFALRMKRHSENAQVVAEFLEQHPAIEKVYYPGLSSFPQYELAQSLFVNGYGGVIAFEMRGGYDAGVHLMNNVKLCSLAVSLGHVDTLIEHPASMTHKAVRPEIRQQAGITDGLVRLAVGIEEPSDIIDDLEQAMIW